MTKQVQRRRGTSTQHTSFTGADGEISVNTTNKTIHVHDGVTTGGFEAARIDLTNVTGATVAGKVTGSTLSSLTITSADINGGTIDSTAIGNTTPSSGIFTTLSASSTLTLGGTAVTSTAAELNILDGVTSTAAELNILDGVTATAAELNILDGVTATAAEINFVDGVTSNVQTQINTKVAKAGDTMTGNLSFGDNNKAIFGAELEIYSDATHARIREYGGGQLKIQGDNLQLLTTNGASTYLEGVASTGAVTLYHAANAPRISTTATGIDVTGTVAAGAGTALLPSITTTGDLNTGMWFPAADTIAFSEGGVEALRINSSGNVGIGTASPTGKLDLFSNVTSNTISTLTFSANNSVLAKKDYVQFVPDIQLNSATSEGGGYTLKVLQQGAYKNSIVAAGITNNSSNYLAFSTTSEAIRIISSGNVGIGTSSPNFKLSFGPNIGNTFAVYESNGSNLYGIGMGGDGSGGNPYRTKLFSNGSEAVSITSAGSVGIGTGAPVAKLAVVGGTSNASDLATAYSLAAFNITPKSTSGYSLQFGSGPSDFPYIQMSAGGTSANSLLLNPYGGEVRINNTADATFAAQLNTQFTSAKNCGLYLKVTDTSGGQSMIIFGNTTNDAVGSISTSGSATAYNTSSDYRLKTDAQPMVGASARVQALKPVNFAWIVDGSRVDGFLAHEAQEIVPEAVVGTKDAMRDQEYEVTAAVEATYDEDGNELTAAVEAVMGTRSVPDYQGIDQSKLVPLLTAALQEALNKIDAMEIRLSALEG